MTNLGHQLYYSTVVNKDYHHKTATIASGQTNTSDRPDVVPTPRVEVRVSRLGLARWGELECNASMRAIRLFDVPDASDTVFRRTQNNLLSQITVSTNHRS